MMASKCKRMQLSMAPAFDLGIIDQHNDTMSDSCNPAVPNAAACQEMSDILGCLVLGSWRDAADPQFLKSRGITHVLNVAKEVPPPSELAAMESGDFAHKRIPLMDCHSEDIANYFEEAFSFIEEAKKQNGKVLVHCRRGISRSPAIVVGYLMRHEGYSYPEALDFVKKNRSCVSLNLAFRTMLEEYQPTPREMCLMTSTYGEEEVITEVPAKEKTPLQAEGSAHGDDFGLSAPESERSNTVPPSGWGDETEGK